MGKINKEWHLANKMPAKATDDQRIEWHRRHAQDCACRPIPKGVLQLLEKRKAGK